MFCETSQGTLPLTAASYSVQEPKQVILHTGETQIEEIMNLGDCSSYPVLNVNSTGSDRCGEEAALPPEISCEQTWPPSLTLEFPTIVFLYFFHLPPDLLFEACFNSYLCTLVVGVFYANPTFVTRLKLHLRSISCVHWGSLSHPPC